MVLGTRDGNGAGEKKYKCSPQGCHSICHEIVSGYEMVSAPTQTARRGKLMCLHDALQGFVRACAVTAMARTRQVLALTAEWRPVDASGNLLQRE
jgi:hypothetical protein